MSHARGTFCEPSAPTEPSISICGAGIGHPPSDAPYHCLNPRSYERATGMGSVWRTREVRRRAELIQRRTHQSSFVSQAGRPCSHCIPCSLPAIDKHGGSITTRDLSTSNPSEGMRLCACREALQSQMVASGSSSEKSCNARHECTDAFLTKLGDSRQSAPCCMRGLRRSAVVASASAPRAGISRFLCPCKRPIGRRELHETPEPRCKSTEEKRES